MHEPSLVKPVLVAGPVSFVLVKPKIHRVQLAK